MTTNEEKIAHYYSGAVKTASEIMDYIGDRLEPTQNNLTMRLQLQSFGYNRVSRAFADKMIQLVNIRYANY